jgi:timeless
MCSSHEIQATLNSLGYLEDGEYFKSKDCLNAAKDLARYLRRDDANEKPVRRELLKSDVISNDLIPLMKKLKSKKADAELYDIVLRLLVNLTQSAFNCYEQQVPEDKIQFNYYIEIDTRLKSVKESFADEEFAKTISEKLDELVNKDWQDRPEEEELIIERLLYLIRNILLIKPSDEEVENRLSTDLNSHDLLLL